MSGRVAGIIFKEGESGRRERGAKKPPRPAPPLGQERKPRDTWTTSLGAFLGILHYTFSPNFWINLNIRC
jgi:hypothetical protein